MANYKRGEVRWCELNGSRGFEESKVRPVIIVQNDIGNEYSRITTVVPITTRKQGSTVPTHYHFILNSMFNTALVEQIRAVDESRIGNKLGEMRPYDLNAVVQCVIKNLGG